MMVNLSVLIVYCEKDTDIVIKRGPHQSKQSALCNISFKLTLPSQSDLLPLAICSEDGHQFLKLVYGTKEYKI